MQEYADKQALIAEIEKTARLFIQEFEDVSEAKKDLMLADVDRTPQQMIAYQLGWLNLLQSWDADEQNGHEVVTPAVGYKWNQLGALYQKFYDDYQDQSLAQLQDRFKMAVDDLISWLAGFSEDELFHSGGRKWASSTWPIWKWVHINTVAPFKNFRSKIRKRKKLEALN